MAKQEILLLENFNADYYFCDKNSDDAELGSGAFGHVFKAKLILEVSMSGMPEEIAIKEVEFQMYETKHRKTEWNLLEEGRNFQNTNLVEMFYVSIEPGRKNKQKMKIFMEFCEQTLHDFMQSRPKLSLADLKHMTVGVLRGLDRLHAQNIIHRDVKPQNILLKENAKDSSSLQDMTIKLTDYNV